MIGSAEGGREGGDEGRAPREEASKDMTRGTHLTAVYPALFFNAVVQISYMSLPLLKCD